MGKIPNFMDSEWLKTPKTDCALKFYKDISLDSRFVDLENTGERPTLSCVLGCKYYAGPWIRILGYNKHACLFTSLSKEQATRTQILTNEKGKGTY